MVLTQEQKEQNKFLRTYVKSENGNFFIKDKIGIPHPYGITHKHLTSESMYLDADAIRHAEKEHQAVCFICQGIHFKNPSYKILSFDEHGQALLVSCRQEIKENAELKKYLLKIKDKAEKNKFVGFSFLKNF
jgi:hypothetical protein